MNDEGKEVIWGSKWMKGLSSLLISFVISAIFIGMMRLLIAVAGLTEVEAAGTILIGGSAFLGAYNKGKD